MGLAAAQARLLTITARKSDCEFQSMSLSHQKIALSRDMENISQEYQNALNKTKLVYDFYGSGTAPMDLDYGLLMRPSIYNDYYPKLLTDQGNRIVLDSKYAAAARYAGIPNEGYLGVPSTSIRDAFIQGLEAQNVITSDIAEEVQNTSYANTAGLGVYSYAGDVYTTEISYNKLLELIKDNTVAVSKENNPYLWDYANDENEKYYGNTGDAKYKDDIANVHSSTKTSYTLYDLLTTNSGTYEYGLGPGEPEENKKYMQNVIAGAGDSFLNWMSEQFETVLGGTNLSDLALQYAYDTIKSLIIPDAEVTKDNWTNNCDQLNPWTWRAWNFKKSSGPFISEKYRYVGLLDENGEGKYVNLNNLAKAYLTAYISFMSNDAEKYSVVYGTNSKLFNPAADDYQFTVLAEASEEENSEPTINSTFYDTLFNQICTHGWTQNNNVNDSSYMQEMLKNGAMFISSISNDGNYYQNGYALDTYISEVADTDAIAQAEAKYNTEKAKIENKESRIDLKMKNLDTEINSLTTEYDSTKSIISKAIEKGFKRYDA